MSIMILVSIIIFIILSYFFYIFSKYFLLSELDLIERYGKDTWVLITGASSGQGKRYAIEFAKRGFNILLSGSKNIELVSKKIEEKYSVKTRCINVDFNDAYKDDFFNVFTEVIDSLPGELSILVNNIGHRTAWEPYHEMPTSVIRDTIVCGTIVQANLTKIAIQKFIKRSKRSAIINVTAKCVYPNFWNFAESSISVPYLSVYEASNAFGFFHSNSIQKEYGDQFDILNITPGAVTTENTPFLKNIPFQINSKQYVKNVLILLGNVQGPTCAHWGHELIDIGYNICSKEYIDSLLNKIGKSITQYTKKNTSV